MSDIHVLTGSRGSEWRVVFHFAVPASNNSVGVSWSDAMMGAGLNVTIMATGTNDWEISTADKALIDSGALFEVSVSIRIETGGGTNQNRKDMLDARYLYVKNVEWLRLQSTLRYFGFARNEGDA